MAKQKKNRKRWQLKSFAEKLESFYSECSGSFMCPTCLRTIAITQTEQITEAHILPRAAGGTLTTLLCKACNSDFGRQQDKWFGEHLLLVKSRKHPIEVARKPNHFFIDGNRVGGWYEAGPNGPLKFYIQVDKTSPKSFEAVMRRASELRGGGRMKIAIPKPPLFKNQRLVNVGFLTAAYLLWFKKVGYSFVLQAHLDRVREQIRNPSQEIIPIFSAIAKNTEVNQPWIGIGYVGGQVALLAGILNRVIFLPPAGSVDFYESISGNQAEKIGLKDVRLINFLEDSTFGPATGIIYGDRFVVWPDSIFKHAKPQRVLFIQPEDGRVEKMMTISGEEAAKLLEKPTTVLIEVSGRLVAPLHETGRKSKMENEDG